MPAQSPTENSELLAWVDEVAQLCQPQSVVWCDERELFKSRLWRSPEVWGLEPERYETPR